MKLATCPQLEHITIYEHYKPSSLSLHFKCPTAFYTLCLFPSGPDFEKLAGLYNFVYANNLTETRRTICR